VTEKPFAFDPVPLWRPFDGSKVVLAYGFLIEKALHATASALSRLDGSATGRAKTKPRATTSAPPTSTATRRRRM
jgi:hypothetical protein